MDSKSNKFNVGVSLYIAVILSVVSFFLGRYIINQDKINERQHELNEVMIQNVTALTITLDNIKDQCQVYDRWWEQQGQYDRDQDKQIYRLDKDVSVLKSKTSIN